MSVVMQVALAFGSVLALLTLMTLIRWLAKRVNLHAEMQRKLMHMGTGIFALFLPWLFPDRWPVYLLIATTLLVMIFLRIPRFSKGLGATLHGVERSSYGDFLLALAVGLCFFFSQGDLLLYILPIAVLTLADAAAALAGTTYGTKHFAVEDGHKSIEGSAVFFVVTLLIAILCLLFLADLPPANILALSLMVAAFGTLVEAQSWRGFDNLFLPLGLLIFLAVHGDSTLAELVVQAGLFLAAIVGFRRLGPELGLTAHASRVYVIAIFLVMAISSLANAFLPILVLAAHLWAQTKNPGDGRFPDLDVVASLGLFSFGWLALGNATGWNAISFYGLSAMGLAMGLSVLALHANLIAIGAVAAGLFALRTGVAALNPAGSNWAEPLTLAALMVLALTIVAPLAAPRAFYKDRVMRLTLLALAIPLGYYAILVFPEVWEVSQKGLSS